jgi:sortase (surface protein transpeptidase)
MTSRRVKRNRMAALGVVGMLSCAGWLICDGAQTSQPPQPTGSDAFPVATAPARAPASAGPSVSASSAAEVLPMAASVPTRIRIPTIDVDAPVVPLGQDATEHLRTPPETDRNLAGWYSAGPTPGSAGNAVMDGHVDTRRGPAVFYNLGALRRKDPIEIDRRDGTVALFAVDAVELYQKNAFPDQRVYGPSRDPELRVITCGGTFSKRGGYQANIVVYAHLVGRGSGARAARGMEPDG